MQGPREIRDRDTKKGWEEEEEEEEEVRACLTHN